MAFRVVDTDNFGGDYPDERWVGEVYNMQEGADAVAEEWNYKWCRGDRAPRYAKVVELPYELQPGRPVSDEGSVEPAMTDVPASQLKAELERVLTVLGGPIWNDKGVLVWSELDQQHIRDVLTSGADVPAPASLLARIIAFLESVQWVNADKELAAATLRSDCKAALGAEGPPPASLDVLEKLQHEARTIGLMAESCVTMKPAGYTREYRDHMAVTLRGAEKIMLDAVQELRVKALGAVGPAAQTAESVLRALRHKVDLAEGLASDNAMECSTAGTNEPEAGRAAMQRARAYEFVLQWIDEALAELPVGRPEGSTP